MVMVAVATAPAADEPTGAMNAAAQVSWRMLKVSSEDRPMPRETPTF